MDRAAPIRRGEERKERGEERRRTPWSHPGLRSVSCAEERMEERMNVDLIFRIAAIGIIVAVLNQLLIRSGREEQAMMTTLAGLIVVLMMVIQEIDALFQSIKSIFGL